MVSEQMQGEIANLSAEIHEIDDPRECVALVQERIRACRQAGFAVPEDLLRIERNLQSVCMAESQGR
jgi:hypothetical protein